MSEKETKPEPLIDTYGVRLTFGTHYTKLITRVPVGYLRWMLSQGVKHLLTLRSGEKVPAYAAAGSEIVRRGERIPDADVSPHAIDRLSQKFLKVWRRTKKGDEGLFAWAQRMVLEAMVEYSNQPKGCSEQDGKISVPYEGVTWVIETRTLLPVLITAKEFKIPDAIKKRRKKKMCGGRGRGHRKPGK